MENTIVYRVQNRKGEGYMSSDGLYKTLETRQRPGHIKQGPYRGTERWQYPDADYDTQLGVLWNYMVQKSPFVFGFENLEHLWIWFDRKHIDALYDDGFQVCKMTVPSHAVIKGTRQLAFHRGYILKSEVLSKESLQLRVLRSRKASDTS